MPVATRILLLHSNRLFREGLTALLRTHDAISVVLSTSSPDEATRSTRPLRPHLALVEMRDETTLQACRAIHAAHPRLPIVLLGGTADLALIVRALREGGSIYLPSDADPSSLLISIRQARQEGRAVGPRLSTPHSGPVSDPLLSPRERDVLRLVAKGHANRLIGRRLAISENTVRNHLANAYQKLEVSDRTRAALIALQRGLL